MAICSKCGSQEMEFKQGVSKKNGKPWKGYKCALCSNMDFIDDPKPATPQKSPVAAGNGGFKGNSESIRAMCMSYAKDLVVGQIAANIPVDRPAVAIISTYRLLYKEVMNPGSVLFKDMEEEVTPPAEESF